MDEIHLFSEGFSQKLSATKGNAIVVSPFGHTMAPGIATPLSFSRIEKCATIDGMALGREEANQLSPDPGRDQRTPLGGLTECGCYENLGEDHVRKRDHVHGGRGG